MTKRTSAAALKLVRKVFAGIGHVEEMTSHGSPAWFALTPTGKRGKQIAAFADNHHGDGRLSIWCASVPDVQALLVEQDPRTFFVPPYVGPRGWIGVILDDVAEEELARLLKAAHETVKARPRGRSG